MPVVSVPRSFFESERNTVYGTWQTAFWRELLSNSLDAGASSILARTRFDEAGDLLVDFWDNGGGMTRDIVENVYMSLGASTKREEDGIGGFGRARVLTCFSQKAYRIRTQDVAVNGAGASYQIEGELEVKKGCAVTIKVDGEQAARLHRGLVRVLRESSLKGRIQLDLAKVTPEGDVLPQPFEGHVEEVEGQPGLRYTGGHRRGRHLEDLQDGKGPWAEVWISRDPGPTTHNAILRVKGMAMYAEYLGAPLTATVELEPARAREVLTASRDGIREEFRRPLQELLNRIATETRTCLREKSREPISKIFTSRADQAAGLAFPRDHVPPPAPPRYSAHSQNTARAFFERVMEKRPQEVAPDVTPEVASLVAMARGEHLLNLRLDVAVQVENPTPKQAAAVARWSGKSWVEKGGDGRNAELTHAAWTAACRHALKALTEVNDEARELAASGRRFVTGFVFDRSILGQHRAMGDVPHALLLNPVDDDGAARYKLSDPASMKKLISIALHEVCHVVCSRHDEDFAGVFTDLVGAVRDRDIEAAIRDELAQARDYQAQRELAHDAADHARAELQRAVTEYEARAPQSVDKPVEDADAPGL